MLGMICATGAGDADMHRVFEYMLCFALFMCANALAIHAGAAQGIELFLAMVLAGCVGVFLPD